MRKIIAALQVSVDGFIEGSNGELDWVDTWEDPFDLVSQIDTCILGRGDVLRLRAVLAHHSGQSGRRVAVHGEGCVEGRDARFADTATHVVLSKTLEHASWHKLRLVVRPIVLGGGKALFKDVKERHPSSLLGSSR